MGNCCDGRDESCGCGVVELEPVFGLICHECGCDVGKKEALDDLHRWAKEGDGSV